MFPYFRSMEAFFNLSLPPGWQSLSDHQLLYFFHGQLSRDLPMEEILTLCLFKWGDITVLCHLHNSNYLVRQRHKPKHEAQLTFRQTHSATASLDFLRHFPASPVRITRIGKAEAIDKDFTEVPFSTFISCDNHYQGFLHTKNESLLKRPRHAPVPRRKEGASHQTISLWQLLLVRLPQMVLFGHVPSLPQNHPKRL